MQKWEKQNTIKYAAWNVNGIAHKCEELECIK